MTTSNYQPCGDCNLCCKLLETHDVPSKIGTYCEHCSDKGCGIYNERPKECSTYQCMWTMMPAKFATIDLRPDNCGIIFDRQSEDVITARIEEDKKIDDLLMGQIRSFNKEGFSVLVFRGNERKHFLAEGFTETYVEEEVYG